MEKKCQDLWKEVSIIANFYNRDDPTSPENTHCSGNKEWESNCLYQQEIFTSDHNQHMII